MNGFWRTVLLLAIAVLAVVSGDEYSELVKTEVGVRILPLKVEINSTEIGDSFPNCTLTLHRGTCGNRALKEHERLSWSTRVCFLWKCDVEEHAMRVGSCWIGSQKNPVTIIKDDGCTQESAIVRSPSYVSATRAISVGWLSVREQGMTHVHVHCTVHLCHLCDDYCSRSTPPRHCRDVLPRQRDHLRVWNSSAISDLCSPTLPPIDPSPPSDSASFTPLFLTFIPLFARI